MRNELKRSHCNIYSESWVRNQKCNGCLALLLFCRFLTTAHCKIYVRTDLQWVQDAMEISDERQVKKRPSSRAVSASPNTQKARQVPKPWGKVNPKSASKSTPRNAFFPKTMPTPDSHPKTTSSSNCIHKAPFTPKPTLSPSPRWDSQMRSQSHSCS